MLSAREAWSSLRVVLRTANKTHTHTHTHRGDVKSGRINGKSEWINLPSGTRPPNAAAAFDVCAHGAATEELGKEDWFGTCNPLRRNGS